MTRIFDLHFLLDPQVFAWARVALAAALLLYVRRLAVWLALPVALFVHCAANAITNSQGAIQHAVQIVSLVLLAQTAAHFFGLWRRRNGEARHLLEDRTIWWSQQTIVAVYLVAGITKLFVTKGLWIYQARWIGVGVAKSAYQSFYDTFNQADLEQQLAVANFAASHGWIVALIAATGLLLELGSPADADQSRDGRAPRLRAARVSPQPRLHDAADLYLQSMAADHLHDQRALIGS